MFPRGIVVFNFWSVVFLKRHIVKFYGSMLASFSVVLLKFFEFLWFVSAEMLYLLVRFGSAIGTGFKVIFWAFSSEVDDSDFWNVLGRFCLFLGRLFHFFFTNGDCKKMTFFFHIGLQKLTTRESCEFLVLRLSKFLLLGFQISIFFWKMGFYKVCGWNQ